MSLRKIFGEVLDTVEEFENRKCENCGGEIESFHFVADRFLCADCYDEVLKLVSVMCSQEETNALEFLESVAEEYGDSQNSDSDMIDANARFDEAFDSYMFEVDVDNGQSSASFYIWFDPDGYVNVDCFNANGENQANLQFFSGSPPHPDFF